MTELEPFRYKCPFHKTLRFASRYALKYHLENRHKSKIEKVDKIILGIGS